MTKYCSFFVKNLSCPNDDCLYLHRFARDGDCFNKEESSPAKYVLKVGQNGIIEHIITKNKEFWKIANRNRIDRDYKETCFPGLSSAWRKIRSYCKEKGIAYAEKEKSKAVKTTVKTEKRVAPVIVKTSRWSHEEELPIFSRKNAFGEDDDEEIVQLPLKKTTSVRQDYVSKNKEIFTSKSKIDTTKKEIKEQTKKKMADQIFTPKGKSKPSLNGFSPKSEKQNKTSIHVKDKTEEADNANQNTLDTQQQQNTENDITSEIEQVLYNNSSEYTELDKKIFSMLGQTFHRLKKEESEIVKRGQSLSANPTKNRRTCCENIKNIIVNFLTPNEELLSAKSQEDPKQPTEQIEHIEDIDTSFRLFGQSYTLPTKDSD